MRARFWWGKPDGKRPLGRPRYGWEDDIKTELQEISRKTGADWTDVAQEKDMCRDLVKEEMNLRAPYNVSNFWTSWQTVSFSATLFHGVSIIIKANKVHYFSNLFDKVRYMFRSSPLSETCSVLDQINLRNCSSCWLLL